MTSYHPKKCCFQGVKHEGTASGEFITVADFEVYLKYPENKSTDNGIVLYLQLPIREFEPLLTLSSNTGSLTSSATA
jgi:hypothetical protein